MTDFKDPLPNRRDGIPIADGAARAGWKPEPKPRRKLAIASKVNPAARLAAKAEKRGLLRLRLD